MDRLRIKTLEELEAAAKLDANVRILSTIGCERLTDCVGTPARQLIHSPGVTLLAYFRAGMYLVSAEESRRNLSIVNQK